MEDSRNTAVTEWEPYDIRQLDPLYTDCEITIKMFPGPETDVLPARQPDEAMRKKYVNQYKNRKVEFDNIFGSWIRELSPAWESKLSTYIEQNRSYYTQLDINRLARFCVRLGYLPVVEYLVEKQNADLTQRDSRGRSAIFYTMSNFEIGDANYISLLKCIVSSYPDESRVKEILDQTDNTDKEWTPLHYAAESKNLIAIEFFIAMGASTEIKDKEGCQGPRSMG